MYSKVTITLPEDMSREELIMRFNSLNYEVFQLKDRCSQLRKELNLLPNIIFDKDLTLDEISDYWTRMNKRLERNDLK